MPGLRPGASAVNSLDAPTRHAAAVIPVRPGGAILLLKRDDRPDISSPNRWSTLGGYVEPGETPEAAAWREIEEEAGRRPDTLVPAGFADGRSTRPPNDIVRSHLFGARVTWTLDDLILGEGQGIDWFAAEEALALPLAPPIQPGIADFLASDVYRTLATGAPPATPDAPAPLPRGLPAALGLRRGRLLAVRGAPAGFVRRLWDVLDGARVTASPGEQERPDVLLWWPREGAAEDELALWRCRIAPGGSLWIVRTDAPEPAAARDTHPAQAAARAAGLVEGATIRLTSTAWAVRYSRLVE